MGEFWVEGRTVFGFGWVASKWVGYKTCFGWSFYFVVPVFQSCAYFFLTLFETCTGIFYLFHEGVLILDKISGSCIRFDFFILVVWEKRNAPQCAIFFTSELLEILAKSQVCKESTICFFFLLLFLSAS